MGWWGKKNNSDGQDRAPDSPEDIAWIGGLSAKRAAEVAADPSPEGQGRATGHFEIDDMREYYPQYSFLSFDEGITVTGGWWHKQVQAKQALVDQGHTELQDELDFARGARSCYD